MAYGLRKKAHRLRDPYDKHGWRRLGFFWLAVLLIAASGGGLVEFLGPPAGRTLVDEATLTARVIETHGGHGEHGAGERPLGLPKPPNPPAQHVDGRGAAGTITAPDFSLLESAGAGSMDRLPRIGSDGRTPRQIYAATFDVASHLPRVGLVMGGIGLNEAETDAAIRTLPGAVSLAFSPYAIDPTKLLADARAAGHEYLIAIPLEPAGFPLNDPGPATLLTSASEAVNTTNLRWSLSRIVGYAGVTGVIDTMRGERLAAMTDQMDAVLSELAHRGLFYVDPRAGRGPVAQAWGRHVDVVIDEPAGRVSIDARLAELEQQARDHGSALGLVMRPTPVAVARIAAWMHGLTDRGLILAPASALAVAPSDLPVKLSERAH